MFLPNIKSKIILILFIISSALLILSIVLITHILPGLMKTEVIKSARLVKGTEQYDRFVELPFPVIFKVYFFNIENPRDVLRGHKPVLKEVGPYVYKQYRKKDVYSIDEEDDTITYTQRERFLFDNKASGNLSDEDPITILNFPMVSVLQTAEKLGTTGPLAGCLTDIFPNLDTLFIDVKVKDVLFDGIQFCVRRNFSLCEFTRIVACKVAEKKRNIDKSEDGSLRFSFFNYKAKAHDGVYTVKSGIKDVQSLGQIIKWNNLTYTNFWQRLGPNSTCDQVKGSDSTLYPPELSKDSPMQAYSTDVCRSLQIEFSKEVAYKGIKGYLFAANNSTLRSNNVVKTEDCFCAEETQGTDGETFCFLDGVIDVQPCIGAPVLLSFPHFLWADQSYIEAVLGISPNEEKHNTFVTVEPATGTPLEGMKRIQINAVLRPIKHVNQMKNLPRVVLPLLWIEEGISLNDHYIEELQEMYFHKVEIVNIVKWVFLGATLAITVYAGISYIYKRYSN